MTCVSDWSSSRSARTADRNSPFPERIADLRRSIVLLWKTSEIFLQPQTRNAVIPFSFSFLFFFFFVRPTSPDLHAAGSL
ncbi:hypothetical protein BJX96DRAFT_158488 [Aspergillus floccosus]